MPFASSFVWPLGRPQAGNATACTDFVKRAAKGGSIPPLSEAGPARQNQKQATAFSTDLHRQWQKLALEGEQADPFCCGPDWQMTFHQVFAPERRVYHLADAEGCLVLAESVLASGRICLTPLEASWLFGCPLLGRQAPALFSEALVDFAREYAPHFPRIVISGIRPQGPLARHLLERFGRTFQFYRHSVSVQCAASLAGGLDGYLSRRSANHRAKLRKAARHAREQGFSFERHCPRSMAEAAPLYRRMLAVELESWKGKGHCGMAETPAREFYDALMSRLAENGRARLIFARHEDKDIGFIFGTVAGPYYRGQQFSFADQWRPFSIGNLMQLEQIQWLCEEKTERYDMGPISGQRMEYKAHWTEQRMEMQTWMLVPVA